MNRLMFLIGVVVICVLLFAPATMAQKHAGGGNKQTLIRTGGPRLDVPAALVLIGSGAAATLVVRRYVY